MHPARIAELLQPFLSNPCHSEPGQKPGEACPERSRKPALSLPKGEPAVRSPTPPPAPSSEIVANDQRPTTNDVLYKSISTYIDILQHWNARINLTAIRNEEEIVTRHFGESLFAARHLFPLYSVSSVVKGFDVEVEVANDQRLPLACPELSEGTNDRVADVGSGAGFPGIPIKLWAPKISLTLIESNHKKAAFLKEVARALTLTDINIQTARAETLPPATFDTVTLRAVERLAEILPTAANLLTPQGRLALLITSSQLESTRATLPNFTWDPPTPIPQSKSQLLLIGTAGTSKVNKWDL
jgi:16S rRNA (guanine527-N7)-methyltransferase